MADDDEQPKMMVDGHITRGDAVHTALLSIFPEWSSTRISRWLGVNPRTVQRWLKSGRGEFADETIPDDVVAKIRAMATKMENIDLGGQLDHWLETQIRRNEVPNEVLGAWLAHRYRQLMGKDID
jgi:IS30 family transposase